MKTTKVILVAALMAFATMGFSQVKSTPPTLSQAPRISATIPFQSAIQSRALVFAMHTQVSPEILKSDRQMYMATVYVNHIAYCVCGTYSEWLRFFGAAVYDPNPAR